MATMSLRETMEAITLQIRAGYPVIYIVSHEETRVLESLAKIVRVIKTETPSKTLLRWSQGAGLEELADLAPHGQVDLRSEQPIPWLDLEGVPPDAVWQGRGGPSEIDALTSIRDAGVRINNPPLESSVTLFFDVHQLLQTREVGSDGPMVRQIRNSAEALRRYYERHFAQERKYKTLIIVAPSAVRLSHELEGDLSVIDFPLPEKDELQQTLQQMLESSRLSFPDPVPETDLSQVLSADERTRPDWQELYRSRLCEMVAGAGRGLTLVDYKLGLNGFAVRGEHLSPSHIETMLHKKAAAVKRNPALEYTPHVDVQLGGLEGIKQWIDMRRGAVTSKALRARYHLPAPKGAMLCGVAGGGKSQLAKYLAKVFSLALLRLDVGALFGSYIGESEERTREALKLSEVLAPVVLWIDEIDKAFKGVGDPSGDGGVSARVFGHFLTWLAEKQDDVFVVATANDFKTLLSRFPEFGRKGRFDEIFWVDLPSEEARRDIFRIYLSPLYEAKHLELMADDVERLAAQLGIPVPEGNTPLDRFCALLGRGDVSANTTGAEIEACVIDALYESYRRDRSSGTLRTFTPDLVLETVKVSAAKALYNPKSPDAITLRDLRQIASDRNWIGAPQGVAGS